MFYIASTTRNSWIWQRLKEVDLFQLAQLAVSFQPRTNQFKVRFFTSVLARSSADSTWSLLDFGDGAPSPKAKNTPQIPKMTPFLKGPGTTFSKAHPFWGPPAVSFQSKKPTKHHTNPGNPSSLRHLGLRIHRQSRFFIRCRSHLLRFNLTRSFQSTNQLMVKGPLKVMEEIGAI